MSNYKDWSWEEQEPCAQLTERVLDKPKVLKIYPNENGNNGKPQQIVPVAQPSDKLSSQMRYTLKEQKDEAFKSNGSIDEATTSGSASTFFSSQSTFARAGPSNKSSDKGFTKLSTSQHESWVKPLQRTYSRANMGQQRDTSQKFTSQAPKSGYQLQSKPSQYTQTFRINSHMTALHKKRALSPSSKLKQAKADFQVALEHHFQSKLKMPETVGLENSHQIEVTKTNELTEPKIHYQNACSSVPSIQSKFNRTVTKSATITSNELIEVTTSWLPNPKFDYSHYSLDVIEPRGLLHLPSSPNVHPSNYVSNRSSVLSNSEWFSLSIPNDSNKEWVHSSQEGNNDGLKTHHDAECTGKSNSSEKELKLVPYRADHSYENPTRSNGTKSTDFRTPEKQVIKSGVTLASSQLNSNQTATNVSSNKLTEQSISWLPGYYQATSDFDTLEIINSPKSRMESTIDPNSLTNGYAKHDSSKMNENNKIGKELMSSPQANMETIKSNSAVDSGIDLETKSPSKRSQNNETVENISSNEHLQLVPYARPYEDHDYAETQSNATSASMQQSETAEMQSQVNEKNHQDSIKQGTTDLQATNNETLINLNNDSIWGENDIKVALSQPFYLLPASSEDLTSTEQLLSFPLQFIETSPSNEIISSNELTHDPVSPTEQTKLKTSETVVNKSTGSKSICLIQQTATPKESSQITLPSSQSYYARAALGDKTIQSTFDTSSTKSTFVQKPSNKFEIQSNVLITSSANLPGQSSNGRTKSNESTQNSKLQQGKPRALQLKLKAPVTTKGNVRVHPYENGSIKQSTSTVKSHYNLPPEDGIHFDVPQDYEVDRVMQKSKTKKTVQWGKLPGPLPKPTDPKKTPSKRKLKENSSPMTPSKRRSLEEQVGVRIVDSSAVAFRLPEISIEKFEMIGGVKQKVGVAGITLKTPLKQISKNKTLSVCAEILLKNNVSVYKIPIKPVDKALENYIKILEKNNVCVVKFKK